MNSCSSLSAGERTLRKAECRNWRCRPGKWRRAGPYVVSPATGWPIDAKRSDEFLVAEYGKTAAAQLKASAAGVGVVTVRFAPCWPQGDPPPPDESTRSTGPLGTALAQMFPTAVRYTGASLAFNLGGILGASLAPYIAKELARAYGLEFVGYYLSGAGIVTLIALIWIRARNALAK